MALSNEILLIGIAFGVNYFWIHRQSQMLSGLFNLLLGGLIVYYGTTLSPAVDPIYAGIGVLIMLISLIQIIWSLLPSDKKLKRGSLKSPWS